MESRIRKNLFNEFITSSPIPFQVWFQNRRAKWRRQEKLESSALKINENYPMTSLVPRKSPADGIPSLPLDPWLTHPITGAATGMPQLLSPLTGGYHHGPGGYFPTTHSPTANQQPQAVNTFAKMEADDPRNTSILSLRLRAKEHMEHMHRLFPNQLS